MIIDAHCDTASVLLNERKVLRKNDLHLDTTRMGKGYTQIFAAFIAPEYYDAPMARAEAIIAKIKKETEKKTNNMALCMDNKDRENALAEGKNAAFISLEGGEPIQSLEDVAYLHSLGVRFATLTWNHGNQLAGGIESEDGISTLGRRVVGEMCKNGMIVDVSHLNDRSFWDVMRVCSWPMIASHSCSRSVYSHPRNLTDEQFKAICSRGGVVGINFYTKFLNGRKTAYIKNIIKHIDHFLSLGGENHIGLGSDFDGVDVLPQDLSGVQDMNALVDAMREHGYTDKIIDKICFGNFERIMRLL